MSTQDYQRPALGDGKPYDPMREPRFTEIATFMRAPLAAALDNVDIGLIGVPTYLGVTNRPGARHGPREIRNASSLMRGFNLGLGVNPYELCRVADLGDVHLAHRYDLERQNADIEAFYHKVKAAGILPVSAGGDHSITYPIFRALGAERPVGMVHVDAHTDTWGEFFGSKFTHGAPFRLAVEAGVRIAIHPDDPPWPLFGLPRVVSTAHDARFILNAVDSPANGLTFCVGSYGARADNDLLAMVGEFAPYIHFVHLRQVLRETDGSFYEAEHLHGSSDMLGVIRALLAEESRRRRANRKDHEIPMRPDHGHVLGDDIHKKTNPGYSYIGRLKGLAELRGVIEAFQHTTPEFDP